jgi:hypothetical protein
MHIWIQPVRRSDTFLVALRDDGWAVELGQEGAVRARHPSVTDEGAARRRLHHLGFLTSGALRIEFCHIELGEGSGQYC